MATPEQPEKKRRVAYVEFRCPHANQALERIVMQNEQNDKIREAKEAYEWALIEAKLPLSLKQFEDGLYAIDKHSPMIVQGKLAESVDHVMVEAQVDASGRPSTGYFATHEQWIDVILPELAEKGFIVTKLWLEDDEDEEEGEEEDRISKLRKEFAKDTDKGIDDLRVDHNTVYCYRISLFPVKNK